MHLKKMQTQLTVKSDNIDVASEEAKTKKYSDRVADIAKELTKPNLGATALADLKTRLDYEYYQRKGAQQKQDAATKELNDLASSNDT
jgi:hypothetical protein